MGKLYRILALLLAIFSMSYSTAAIHLGDVKTTFSDGDEVLIYSATANEYLAGFNTAQTSIVKTSTLGEANVYLLISAPSINGNPTFILKQKSSERYMQVLSTNALHMNARESNATPFQLMAPTQETCVRWWPYGLEDYDATVNFSDITLMGIDNPNVGARDTIPTLYLSGYWAGYACNLWDYADTNAWVFYSIDSSSRPAIGAILEQYSTESFVAGTEPALYPQELVDAFVSAYNTAEIWYNNPAATEEELAEVYSALSSALQAVIDGVIPFSGYYRIINAFNGFYEQQGVEKAIFDNGGQLVWTSLNEDVANQVFSFEQLPSGNFTIQNLFTGRYINNNSGQSAATYTSVSPQYETIVTEIFPEDGYNEGEKQFNLRSSNSSYAFHVGGHGGGAGVSGTIVGWDGGFGGGSAWILRAVSDEEVAVLVDAAQQDARNATFTQLITEGYSAYYAVALARTGLTGPEQFSSNADHNALNETPDGDGFPALLDGDTNTFFHSCWSAAAPAENHYLQVELAEATDEYTFSYTRRMGNNNNRPTEIAIWASNDTETWDSITTISSGLPTESGVNSYASQPMSFDMPYKHIRFVVLTTNTGGSSNGFPFFTFSEFNVYSVQFNENGPIKEYREIADKLFEELQKADLIESPTQADIDALQTAYNNFIAEVPDPAELVALITSATSKANSAVEGNEIGQYTEGALAKLLAAIEAAQLVADSESPSKATYAAAIEALNEALSLFSTALNSTIVPNKWYYIRGSNQALDRMRDQYIVHRDTTSYALGFASLEEGNDRYLWRFIALDDSLYAIQNAGSGEFIATYTGHYTQTAATLPGKYMITSLGGDAFNIHEYGVTALHGQADYTTIVHWAGGIGTASVWTFIDAGIEEETELITVMDGFTQEEYTTMCLPISLDGILQGTAYSIIGTYVDGDNNISSLNLKEFEGGVVPAGVPFILKAEASEIFFSWGSEGTNEASQQNGLVGTFSPLILENGYGYIAGSMVSISNGGYVLPANKAYIDEMQITMNEDSEDFIDVDGILTHIGTATTESEFVDVYTVTGVRVRAKVNASEATTGLNKGLYIVGKKKVFVK